MRKRFHVALLLLGIGCLSFPWPAVSNAAAGWERIWGPVGTVVVGWVFPHPDVPGGTEPIVYATKHPEGDIYVYDGTPFSWTKIGGPGKKFVTHGNTLHALAPDGGGVFQYMGVPGQWQKIGGPASDIYGGLVGLFAVNPQTGDVYGFNSNCGSALLPGWTNLGKPPLRDEFGFADVKMYAVGALYLYGLRSDGRAIYLYDFEACNWTQLVPPPGIGYGFQAEDSLYVGHEKIYASGRYGIYAYVGAGSEEVSGMKYIGGPGTMFAIDPLMGDLYGLSPDGSGVYRYTGIPRSWEQIGGAAATIFAGWPTVFATNPDTQDLYRFNP